MDDIKKEAAKSKPDPVRNLLQCYRQKRNYTNITPKSVPAAQHITYSQFEKELNIPNSILYSCHNNDPILIDQCFSKFLAWLNDLTKTKNTGHDLEYLIAPLFCHLYLDIQKAKAAADFLKVHLPSIDRNKCDDFVRNLINVLANEGDASYVKQQFRSNKYFVQLSAQSVKYLKKFVLENAHVFLQTLQRWFDIEETEEMEDESGASIKEAAPYNGVGPSEQCQRMLDVIRELENEPQQIFQVDVASTNEPITAGLIKRALGIIAYNQNNILHLKPINSHDPIITVDDCKEIRINNHSRQIHSIAISPDLSYLVTSSADSTLCIYLLREMRLIRQCVGHLGPVYCTSVGSNNVYIASGSQDNTARLWSTESGNLLRVFIGHSDAVTSVDFHPNCLYLGTGSADKSVRLWSVDNGTPLRLFHGGKGVVYAVAFSPLGDCLASASDDKQVRIWNVLQSQVSTELAHNGEAVSRLVWSCDGKQLCSGALDGVIRIWPVDSGQQIGQEPTMTVNTQGKLLHLEYAFQTFGCVTAPM